MWTPPESPPPALPLGRQQGAQAFVQAIRAAVEQASLQGWREWWWSDADFADWPLGEAGVVDALNRWAQGGRHLRLLARDFRAVQRLHPRFVRWRTTWDHLVEARVGATLSEQDLPSCCWTPVWTCQRIDRIGGVLLCSDEASARASLQLTLREAWGRSTPGFGASVLGL
jgi:hypothetical protein